MEPSDPTRSGPEFLLQHELLTKLNLPPDNPPEWFPCRRVLPTTASTEACATGIINSITEGRLDPQTATERFQPSGQHQQYRRTIFSGDGGSSPTNFAPLAHPQGSDHHRQTEGGITEEKSEVEAFLDDDDFLLASVVENFENMASAAGGVIYSKWWAN